MTDGPSSSPACCPRCGGPLGAAELAGRCSRCLAASLSLPGGEPADPFASSAEVFDRLDDYELLEEVGRGGMGVVFRARQVKLDREVALKVIRDAALASSADVDRFRDEAAAAARLAHPHIVRVHDIGEAAGRPYFAMEFIAGRHLGELTRGGPLSARVAAELVAKLADALQHAHERGVLHRDLKPSNVIVDAAGEPHVTDFGLAKRFDPADAGARATDLTLTGQMLGTPAYMAPEQAGGRKTLGPTADVYSLGALLFHLLTRRPPFVGDTLPELFRSVAEQEPKSPRLFNPVVPEDLASVCPKCLTKEPDRRYSSAQALADDLGRFLRKEPTQARPLKAGNRIWRWCRREPALAITVAIATLIAAAGIAGVVWQWQRAERYASAETRQRALVERNKATDNNSGAAANLFQNREMRPVSGVVVSLETGNGVAGALVRVSSPGIDMRSVRDIREGVWDTRTDASGRFTVQVPHSPKISLNAFAAGYQEAAGTFTSVDFQFHNIAFPAEKWPEVMIRLRPAQYVSGRVTDEAGRPVAEVSVEATMRDERSTAYLSFDKTGLDGKFEIFDFPLSYAGTNARGQLTFRALSKLTQVVTDIYPIRDMERTNLHVTLRSGRAVRGVAAADGKPAADLVVEAIPDDIQAATRNTRTDADGKFVVHGLPDGEVTLRAHSLSFDQRARTTIRLSGTDAVADLQVEPVVLKNFAKPVALLGMKLADMTPELQALYDLGSPTGVVILDPGAGHSRLGIGKLSRGDRFWIVGQREVHNLRDMVEEILRIDATSPPGRMNDRSRGMIRVVYSYRGGLGTNTQWLTLTEADVAELEKLRLSFEP